MPDIQLSRRHFLKSSAIATGMLLTIPLPNSAFAKGKSTASNDWCVYVSIHQDNSVEIASPVMEMGQHMKTAGPMLMADELDLDWQLVSFAKDCPAYLNRNKEGELGYKYSDMGTGGSHALRRNWDYMRKAGATVRQMLLEQAAEVLNVQVQQLTTEKSHVIDTKSGKSIPYGTLAKAASHRKVDLDKVQLKDKSNYQIMGKDVTTIDIHDIVRGKPLFGIDENYPNALQVVIHRAPALGAKVKSFDKDAALAVKGVKDVIEVKPILEEYWGGQPKQVVASGIAVVATNLWSAMQGKKALNTQWQLSATYTKQNSQQQQQHFHQQVQSNAAAKTRKEEGDVELAFKNAKQINQQVYDTPLFAHACMEPFNCIADIRDEDATIVVGHQFPHDVAAAVEKITGIDGLNVEVISKRMGGGFGRRFEKDFLYEAISLSKILKHPVKVTWTREDEIEHDFFAPAYVMQVKASLDENDKINGWLHRQAQTRGGARDDCFPAKVVKNYKTEHFESDSLIPTGPWRGPGHMQWTFAVESMTDELAYMAKQDPLAFRLQLMQPYQDHEYKGWGAEVINSGRMAKCYESAAKMANWGRKLKKNHGLGIAGHFTFGSYAAFVIEVSVNENDVLQIHDAWGAIDCGFAVNPNHVRNQMEGGFIDGLNAALFNKVNIVEGQVTNNNFNTLEWMRMTHSPNNVEVDIIQNDYPPTGVGEPPTAPAAAALANAIYAACGRRIRSLPINQFLSV